MVGTSESFVAFGRSVIAFVTLFLFARILGKQQITQLTFFEYATGITIGSIAAELSVNLSAKGLVHWIGLATWTGCTLLLQWMATRNRQFAKIVEGEPVVVIQNGKIFYKNLRLLRFTIDDLVLQLRQKDVFDLSEVEFAILENNGTLSVLKKSQHQPVTPKDLDLPTAYKGISTELIVDGEVIEQNLKQVQLDREWLLDQLRARGIASPDAVVYASLSTQGELYVSLYRDEPAGAIVDVSDYRGSQ